MSACPASDGMPTPSQVEDSGTASLTDCPMAAQSMPEGVLAGGTVTGSAPCVMMLSSIFISPRLKVGTGIASQEPPPI
jgi:hypothetical protein